MKIYKIVWVRNDSSRAIYIITASSESNAILAVQKTHAFSGYVEECQELCDA